MKDTSGLHQSLWCEVVKLLNSTFSGVRLVAMDTLARQDAFDQDELAMWEACQGWATVLFFKESMAEY